MEKLIVEVPPESLCIREASCPNGHSLMDGEHLMDGHPAIRVEGECGGESGTLHLHPRYGNFEIHSAIEMTEGEIYDLFCPECRTSLRSEEDRCLFCGAPMFSLRLPRGGMVQGCCRRGCHNHKLRLVDLSAQLAGLFDLDVRPGF